MNLALIAGAVYCGKTRLIDHTFLMKRKPIVAVLGLNPHNSELRYNSEERKVIIPAIKKLKKDNYKIIGPFSSDTIFLKKKKYQYDVIVGMYHDQVLIPMKTLFKFNAINLTIGLPFIRVTPDHGPNHEMLGKNKSNPSSMFYAIKFFNKIL